MKKVIMFPGQGSQHIGMGEELLNKYADTVKEAEELLGYDIRNLILNPESEAQLNQTQYTQPLLYLVSALSWMDIHEEQGHIDIFIGHSLGEYNALQAAGSFDLITGLKMVKLRAGLMAEAGQSTPGGMVAVIGLGVEQVKEAISACENVEVANYNSNIQVVLTGDRNELASLEEHFKEVGAKRFIMLPVSGAFHSKYMKKAAAEFGQQIGEYSLASPKVLVYSNVDAEPYVNRKVSDLLEQQIYSSVLWVQTVKIIKEDNKEQVEFLEVGPSNVLTGLVKRI